MLILGLLLLAAAASCWFNDPGHSQTLLIVSRLAALGLGALGLIFVALGAV